jgi:hypothetical protein
MQTIAPCLLMVNGARKHSREPIFAKNIALVVQDPIHFLLKLLINCVKTTCAMVKIEPVFAGSWQVRLQIGACELSKRRPMAMFG